MKISECRVGQVVKGQNIFDLRYKIIALKGTKVEVQLITDETEMRGGKLRPVSYSYVVKPSILTLIGY